MGYLCPDGYKRFWSYIPAPLYAQLLEEAQRARRTLAAEIQVRLEHSFQQTDLPEPAEVHADE